MNASDHLWVLDYKPSKGIGEGQVKLLDINLKNNQVEKTYHFEDLDRVHSALNDIRVDTEKGSAYITYQALVLFGLPQAVFTDFATFRKDGEVEDYVEVILYYPDKRVKLRESNIAVHPQDAYIFHGLEGSFFKSRSDMQEERLLDGAKPAAGHWCDEPENEEGRLYYLKDEEKIKEIIPTEDGNYYRYFEDVYQTMRRSAPSPVTGLDGYKTMLVMGAPRKSVEEVKIIQIAFRRAS